MIPAIQELNFPKKDGEQYATLTHATATLADMGEKTISTQVKIDGDIVPDFSYDWEVEFQGEKYIMPLRIPQGAKENTTLNSTIDLTFQHWAIYQLKRWTFVTMQPIQAGAAIADEEVASVQLNLKDFCDLFGQVLEYYYGDTITIDLNPAWLYDNAPTLITISHTYIWNVLIDAFHGKYGVRWAIEPREDNDNTVKGGERYAIKVGYPTTEVDHIFEYGFEGGLLKLERQVQSDEIHNMIKGRGGETNIPFRYFKDIDPKNPDFKADPDWVEELANIYFTNLRGATFRSYVQGWKAAHISKYPGYKAVGENNAYSPWAYRKGFTDTKFHPEEFVADEITITPEDGDRQVEILPGYSPYIKKGSSIDKYGSLPATLDNNDDIYPTIQGTGLDIAVDVEQIESDDVEESVENDAKIETKNGRTETVDIKDMDTRTTILVKFPDFTVPSGQTAILTPENVAKKAHYVMQITGTDVDVTDLLVIADTRITVVNKATGEKHSASGIPSGSWFWMAEFDVELTLDPKVHFPYRGWITVGYETYKVQSATLRDSKWANTFDVWVKNIWNSSKLPTETDTQYSERVWKPILGDREKNTAKVVFTSGALAISEDYEFTIVGFPAPDTSKAWQEKSYSGVVIGTHTSHWRITLAKSDAELEATGLYVPSTQKQGKAGDTFVFIGTEMTHAPYVVDAEKRLDDWKKDQLGEVKEIKPTFVVTTDRVRLNNEGKSDALINQLRVGNSIRLADKRFIQTMGDRAYETLYLQSITYTYREPSSDDAALNPDVEIVLGDEYTTSANPVSMMQGEISALQRQIGSISNVEQIVRAVGDRLYLRKDGISDRSLSPTQFFSLLTSGDFRAGLVGGAGWGFFKDENGNWVLEADRVNVRQEMQVNTLVINQAEGRGGMEIDTAAFMEVTRVVDADNGYVCYFDQKGGSVANLFHVDDVAFCNRWTPENQELKFYKRRVTAIGVDNITLSKTDANGTGIPAEKDNIIHFGNYTDKTRQYVKVRDVVGGGYERYIEELNSVNAAGVEYYFVGKQAGESRWFVGNKDLVPYSSKGDGSYIEYINRRFNLNNVTLSINTTIGDKTIDEYIKLVSPPVEQEDIEVFVNNIVDPKLGEIQDQIDGVIETWFANGVPTLTSYPANGWTTDALKIQHLGDLYYDNDTGTAYRFSQNAQGGYYWNVITDDAITKALAAAKTAQDTADGKRRVFTSQPVPPYDEGDLWVNATFPAGTTAATRDPANGKFYNDILRCGTARATGVLKISDWGLSSNYTDDTTANKALDAVATYEYIKNALEQSTQIVGGLTLTTLLSLGYTDGTGLRHTLAGMNGSWIDTLGGRTIASWYGGEMIDLFDVNDNRITPLPANAASALIRMDGSAYFAAGNIGFRADGSGWLGNDTNGIKFGTDGSMLFGNGIKINLSSGEEGLAETLESVLNLVSNLSTLLKPINAQGEELQWSQAANAYALLSKVHFAAKGEVTAYASGGVAGGGFGGSLGDLKDVTLGSLAAGDVIMWDGQKWVNGQAPGGGLDEEQLAAYLTANNYITQADLGNYVTVDGGQTITGGKRFAATDTNFTKRITVNGTFEDTIDNFPQVMWHVSNRQWTKVVMDTVGALHIMDGGAGAFEGAHHGIVASQFVKHGGTASQFLKADGSVDDTSYFHHRRVSGLNIDSAITAGGIYEVNYAQGTLPFATDWLQVFDWDTGDAGYRVQMCTGYINDSSMYFRHKYLSKWGAWREILDSANFQARLDDSAYFRGSKYWAVSASDVVNGAGFSYANGCPAVGPVLDFGCSNYGLQINADYRVSSSHRLHFRTRNGDAGSWNSWHELARVADLAAYLPLSGGTMSNTNVVSNLNADLLDGRHNGWVTAAYLKFGGNQGARTGFTPYEDALAVVGVYANGYPTTYGNCLRIPGGGGGELLFGWSGIGGAGGIEHLYYRNHRDNSSQEWSEWRTIAFTTDNVASATKLQTARTIYINSYNNYRVGDGVEFDGTGDITLKLPNSLTASDWFRSYGSTGWYNETYGGGIYMSDTTWIRTWQQKSFYTGSGEIRSDFRINRMGYGGSSWNNGYGAYNVAVYNNANQTPLLHAYRDGAGADATGANRLFAIELLNSGALLRFGFGGAEKFEFHNSGYFVTWGDIRSFGNILAEGEITTYSDARGKQCIRPLENRGGLRPVTYIKDGKQCIGFVAQEALGLYPELVHDDGTDKHWLSFNYVQYTAVLQVQIDDHEARIKQLEERL